MNWDWENPFRVRHIPRNHNTHIRLNRLPQNFELSHKLPKWMARLGTAITCLLIMITGYIAHLCFSSITANTFYVFDGSHQFWINVLIVIIVIAICCRCVFGSYFHINITLENFLVIEEIIAAITLIAFAFAPVVITLLIVCQNINGWFSGVNFNDIAQQILYYHKLDLKLFVVKMICCYCAIKLDLKYIINRIEDYYYRIVLLISFNISVATIILICLMSHFNSYDISIAIIGLNVVVFNPVFNPYFLIYFSLFDKKIKEDMPLLLIWLLISFVRIASDIFLLLNY
jgi:hypothetical protein